jgi:hypothetical protein
LCARKYPNSSFGETLSVTGSIYLPLRDLVGIGKELPVRPFGFWGTAGLAGDPGRLMNVLTGVIGVLDGLSIETAKFLCGDDADGSPPRKSCAIWLSEGGILAVGTEGRENARFSSNSSIEGKA